MKVTTEGCLFGAWVARVAESPGRILDIGTGTGLLSLMLAQQYEEAIIDAVEINVEAANQARINFEASKWSDNLTLHHVDVQDYQDTKKYDLVLSNPPFFKQSLLSPVANLNLARHDNSLGQQQLVASVNQHLAEDGSFCVLFPEREAETFRQVAEHSGLHLVRELSVFNSPGSRRFRVIGQYQREEKELIKGAMNTRDINREYTADFVELLKGYYLGF